MKLNCLMFTKRRTTLKVHCLLSLVDFRYRYCKTVNKTRIISVRGMYVCIYLSSMSTCQPCLPVNAVDLLTRSTCQPCRPVNPVDLSTLSTCQPCRPVTPVDLSILSTCQPCQPCRPVNFVDLSTLSLFQSCHLIVS